MSNEKSNRSKYATIFGIFGVSIAAAVFTIVSMKLSGLKVRPVKADYSSTEDAAKIVIDREGKILPEMFTLVRIAVFPKENCKSMVIDASVVGDLQMNNVSTLKHEPCDEVVHPIEIKVSDGGYGLVRVKIEYESDKGKIKALKQFAFFTSSTDVEKKEKLFKD